MRMQKIGTRGQNPSYTHYRLSSPLDGERDVVLRTWVHARGPMVADVLPADESGREEMGRWFYVNPDTGEIRCLATSRPPWRLLTHGEFWNL